MNRDLTRTQAIDFTLIDVEAKNVVGNFCKTGAGDAVDMARAVDCKLHCAARREDRWLILRVERSDKRPSTRDFLPSIEAVIFRAY